MQAIAKGPSPAARLAIGAEQGCGRRKRPIIGLGYPSGDVSATPDITTADRARAAGSHVLSLRQLVAARDRGPRPA